MENFEDRRPILWLIDENKHELLTHANILRRMLTETIEVRAIDANPHLADYLPMLEEARTACIVTDQRLKERGTTDYLGIELAEYLRGINQKIPIYILTNYADDPDEFLGGEWSVEDIIKKTELENEDEQRILASRIMRRMDTYKDILDRREEKFKTLLMKSMHGELKDSELQELEEIRLQKVSPTLAIELAQIKQMDQIIKAHKELMNHFEHFTQEEG